MQREVNEFLESIISHNTRKGYLRALELFQEFSGRNLQETLRLRKKDVERTLEREVERFYTWIIEVKKLSPNTAYNSVVALKSITTFYNTPLKLKRGSCSRIPTMPRDWIPSIEELRLMHNIGDLREKLIISMAKDIPLRVNDFLSIQKKDVKNGNTTFTIRTQKTKTPMQCFLSAESVDLLKIYLAQSDSDNGFLFEGKHGRLNEDSVNLLLKNLVKKAGLSPQGLVRFHMFRKLFISVGASLGINTDILKMLTGKRVKADMSPYYEGVSLHEQWRKINNNLVLTGGMTNGRFGAVEQELGELKEALTGLEKENMTLKVRVNNLQSNTMELEGRLDDYGELLANWVEMGHFTEEEKTAIRMKWNIREWTEEEREQMRAFLALANEMKNEKGEVNDEEFRRRFKAILQKKEGDRRQ